MAFFEHYGGDWRVFKVVPPPSVKYDLMAEGSGVGRCNRFLG